MRNGVKIVGLAGLASIVLAGTACADNRNPWTLYQHNRPYSGASAALDQNTAPPAPPTWKAPPTAVQRQSRPQNPVPAPFGNEYVPLPGEQNSASQHRQPPNPYGYQRPYPPGYGYQYPYGGNLGGQFGFGMNFSPGFGFSGMPFGFGNPVVPYGGGMQPYGGGVPPYGGVLPYGGGNPWSMGFPMF